MLLIVSLGVVGAFAGTGLVDAIRDSADGGEIVFDGPPGDLKDSHLLDIYGGEGWLE